MLNICYYITIKKHKTKEQEENKMKFTIEKVANMIFITDNCGTVFKAWEENEFTEQKLKNAINRISKNYKTSCQFTKTF